MSSRGERPLFWETLVQVSLKADSSIVVGWTGGSPSAWRSVRSGVVYSGKVHYHCHKTITTLGGMVNNCIIKKLIN
jgi:hypothetical protein